MDAAATCNDSCVKSFDVKELNADEKKCVNSCYSKQMVVFSSLQANLSGARRWDAEIIRILIFCSDYLFNFF